jgi:hypothetical protein
MSRHFPKSVVLFLALLLFSGVGALPAAAQTASRDSVPYGAAMLQSLRAKEQALFGPSSQFLTQRVQRGTKRKVVVAGQLTHPEHRQTIIFRERTRYYKSGAVYRRAEYYTTGARTPLLEVWTLNDHMVYASYVAPDGSQQRVSNGRLVGRTQYSAIQ